MALDGIGYLVGISREEDELGAGAVEHEPQRYEGVVDEAVHEVRSVDSGEYQGDDGHAVEHDAQRQRNLAPSPLVVEVEDIHIKREHLSHEDDDVLAQPAIGEHEAAPGKAERPVAGGRDHALEALGHHPLHQLARSIAQLRHEAYEECECEHFARKSTKKNGCNGSICVKILIFVALQVIKRLKTIKLLY